MRKLYHFILCPFSRKVRILMGEKKLPFESVLVRPWEHNQPLADMNPEGMPPVLVEENGIFYEEVQHEAGP